MPKGWVTKPKDCEYCGKPLDLPRAFRQKYHSDCAKAAKKIKHKKWREEREDYDKEWIKKNPEKAKKRKEYQRKYAFKKARKNRVSVINHYGGICECCGEDNLEFLALDHINGGGYEDRKKIGAGSRFYAWIVKNNYPKGFRVLCHNCNASIGYYGYCPHNNSEKTTEKEFLERNINIDFSSGSVQKLPGSPRKKG